jgi:hypothetical protein
MAMQISLRLTGRYFQEIIIPKAPDLSNGDLGQKSERAWEMAPSPLGRGAAMNIDWMVANLPASKSIERSYLGNCFLCHPEQSERSQAVKNTRFFAALRLTFYFIYGALK